ncbi:zinc-ribbon domain-containing protein [Pelagibacteraceae bacterium]|nr:zinc-ribbon domain-containing protein [Pelagibacteraceae bacterium]
MILSCNSCEKKFVVPDQAITVAGRTVQCGSCGNKWKQFPIKDEVTKVISDNEIKKKPNTLKTPKPKKKKLKKTREIDLYSPEYLEKKHGISLNNINNNNQTNFNDKVSFGFYNSLILIIVITIALSKGLHFFQDFIIQKLPFTEFYINYFFESIKNIFEIWKNLISSY